MTDLVFTLQTLTPLLMQGAEELAEVRAASFKGALRYWLRATLGEPNTQRLFEMESAVFGSTQQGSSVRVRAVKLKSLEPAANLRVMPERIPLRGEGFEAGGGLRLTLSSHPLAPRMPDGALKAVTLLVNLGAVGKRARRGGGNIIVTKATLPAQFTANTALEVVIRRLDEKHGDGKSLADYLAWICQETAAPYASQTIPGYPIFCAAHAQVLFDPHAYPDFRAAFDQMWTLSGPYHHSGGAFGDVNPRRASAIHMRVHQSATGFHPLMTILRSGNDHNWAEIETFIQGCLQSGFQRVFGQGGWR